MSEISSIRRTSGGGAAGSYGHGGFTGWPVGSRHLFADPYKVCNVCHGWVDGAVEVGGPHEMIPCGHHQSYESVCPSWGPVEGCTCEATLGYLPHAMRDRGNGVK